VALGRPLATSRLTSSTAARCSSTKRISLGRSTPSTSNLAGCRVSSALRRVGSSSSSNHRRRKPSLPPCRSGAEAHWWRRSKSQQRPLHPPSLSTSLPTPPCFPSASACPQVPFPLATALSPAPPRRRATKTSNPTSAKTPTSALTPETSQLGASSVVSTRRASRTQHRSVTGRLERSSSPFSDDEATFPFSLEHIHLCLTSDTPFLSPSQHIRRSLLLLHMMFRTDLRAFFRRPAERRCLLLPPARFTLAFHLTRPSHSLLASPHPSTYLLLPASTLDRQFADPPSSTGFRLPLKLDRNGDQREDTAGGLARASAARERWRRGARTLVFLSTLLREEQRS
jgi:hypothetical protein